MTNDAWKRQLLGKGSDVARKLEGLLNGKEVDISQGLIPRLKPDEDPEHLLRRFLDQIDRAIKRADTAQFGHCSVCETEIPAGVLDQAPWTERCAAHG